MKVGDNVKHPDHKKPVTITQIDGDMIAFTVYPPLGGGAYRMWKHRATFEGRSW